MKLRTLTALAATTALLALLPGVALAGNPKGAVADAKVLRTLVTESPSAARFRKAQNLVWQMKASQAALARGRTTLPRAVRAALAAIPTSFGGLQAWQPQSTFGRQLRNYALWLVASEHNALARAAATLDGVEGKSKKAQLSTLSTAVKGFVKDIDTLTAANDGQLGAAGQGIPADEKSAVVAFSVSG